MNRDFLELLMAKRERAFSEFNKMASIQNFDGEVSAAEHSGRMEYAASIITILDELLNAYWKRHNVKLTGCADSEGVTKK